MNKINLRYFIIAAIATFFVGVLTQIIVITTLGSGQQAIMVGAGWIGSFWMNLLTAATVAILAGRKVATPFVDSRFGRVVGTAVGFWVGLGAIIGQFLCGSFLNIAYEARIPAGQILVFGLILLLVCVLSASISGRETAHPPEEEEA